MTPRERSICVIGLGYIGLPTAALLANNGYRVTGCDTSEHVVDTINNGEIHIVEPGLEVMVQGAVGSGRLTASLEPVVADIFFICVPTPFKGEDHEPDVSYIEAASRRLAPLLKKGDLVILESTSPIGTTESIAHWIGEERSDLVIPAYAQKEDGAGDIFLAHCPERVLPGHILRELVENDRIIGGINQVSLQHTLSFYGTFVDGQLLPTDCRTAEMAKLTENAFRDVNIAFANELSLICDKNEVNVWSLIELANHHPRVNILQPGPGVGGHCIAVDPWFLVHAAPDHSPLIRAARKVNDGKPEFVIQKITQECERFEKPVLCLLGLAFKPDVDDLRESPAVVIAEAISAKGCAHRVLIVEPHIERLPDNLHDNCELVKLEEGVGSSDILVMLVNHKSFTSLEIGDLAGKALIDTRGALR